MPRSHSVCILTDVYETESNKSGSDRVHIFWNLCWFIHDGTARYLSGTADFVPKRIPPGQMFWAITTTIAFALAAVALLSGRAALLASRLLTVMIIGFGLLVWLPAPYADPHKLINWAGNAENLAIAGAAWIVTDFLSQNRARRWPLETVGGINCGSVPIGDVPKHIFGHP